MELNIAISIVINYCDIAQYRYYLSALLIGLGMRVAIAHCLSHAIYVLIKH